MGTAGIVASAAFYIALIVAWIVGYDHVKKVDVSLLPKFYFMMAAIRITLVLAVVAIYIWLLAENTQEAKQFVMIFLGMYALAMITMLICRH